MIYYDTKPILRYIYYDTKPILRYIYYDTKPILRYIYYDTKPILRYIYYDTKPTKHKQKTRGFRKIGELSLKRKAKKFWKLFLSSKISEDQC